MSARKDKLLAAVSAYLAKVEKKIGAGSTPLVFDAGLVLAPDTTKTYDVKPLFEEHALFDLRSVDVVVTMKDEDPLSVTKDYFINSEASVTYGVNAAGIVIVHNASNTASILCVKISSPTVLK